MPKKVFLVAALVLVMGGTAQASTVVSPDSSTAYPFQRWVDRAGVQTPTETEQVIFGPCPGATVGCADPSQPEIWVTGGRALAVKEMFFHELGHRFDSVVLTDPDRAYFMQTMGLSGEWQSADVEHNDRPGEVFAEVYKACAMGSVQERWKPSSHLAPITYVRTIRSLCGWMDSL